MGLIINETGTGTNIQHSLTKAATLTSSVTVLNVNTVTPAQVSVNYGPVFSLNEPAAGGGATEDHEHPEYITTEALTNLESTINDALGGVQASIGNHEDQINQMVRNDDSRLSDARTPTAHRHDYSELDNTPSIPTTPEDINAQPAGNYIVTVNGFEADENGGVVVDAPSPLEGMSGVVVVRSGEALIPPSLLPGTIIVQVPNETEFIRSARVYVHSGGTPIPTDLPVGTVVVRTN